ncbi:MAG: TolC family protein [Gammaproteobacteria bacterium]|nr:TolC family protein [Gammaproteobacteria bacterium]
MKIVKVGAWLLLWVQADAAALDYATNGDPALADLVSQALERNPQVRQAQWDHRAAQERVRQVIALPDPMVSVTRHLRTPETRVGPQTGGISVSQRIPWFGKRSDEGKVAESQAAAREEMVGARRAEVVRQVKLAYYDLAYLDRAIEITAEEEELLRHYESLAQARYSQGVGLQQAVVKLQAEITRVRFRRQELLRKRTDAEAALNALRDQPVHVPIPTVSPPDRPVVKVDGEELQRTARADRPELKAAVLRMESEDGSVRLARRQYWPDIVVGAAWGSVGDRRDAQGRMQPPFGNGKDVYSVSVGINIPLYRSRYDAGVQAASARHSAAAEAYRNLVNEVDVAVRSAVFRLEMIEDQVALFKNALLPQAEQALRSTEEAYSTGTTGVLELLDSEEVLLDVRLGLARLEADYMKTLAEVERAIGSAFPAEDST